jgi:prepilin-type N-terminal cleavage/methylation domain-containing protein
MKIITKRSFLKLNENGFTLTELVIASAISLALLAIIGGVIKLQGNTFKQQIGSGQMQANGRAAVDFISRSIQNAGYNIARGSRFLAASDHYISTVFDDNDDGVIQNDEIIIISVASDTGQSDETIFISPYFDFNDDGRVDRNETRDYQIGLSLSKKPFNLYLFIPNKGNSEFLKNSIVRNIDNLVIRYYDKNNVALPQEVSLDVNGKPKPPYVLSKKELNQIRTIEFEVNTRAKDKDPNDNYVNNGNYIPGSVATRSGSIAFSDRYHRQVFKAVSSPRNLITAPFGIIALTANPNPINCPQSKTLITASLVDSDGNPVSENNEVRFNASSGDISPAITFLDNGETFTSLGYDWATSNLTTTVSASTQIEFEGKKIAIYNAIPITFDAQFMDDFDNGPNPGWMEYPAPTIYYRPNWIVEAGKYRTREAGKNNTLNGCEQIKNYEIMVTIQKNTNHSQDNYFGLIFRSPSSLTNLSRGYYLARVVCHICIDGNPANHTYKMELVDRKVTGEVILESILLEPDKFAFNAGEDYTFKIIVQDENLIAKFWESSELEPSDEPPGNAEADPVTPAINGRTISVENFAYTQGKIGLTSNTKINTFDNIVVTPLS